MDVDSPKLAPTLSKRYLEPPGRPQSEVSSRCAVTQDSSGSRGEDRRDP
jgi:hypothetical protein